MIDSIVKEIEKNKIIAIIRDVDKEKIIPLVAALIDGGVYFIETTFTQGSDDLETYQKIKILTDTFKGKAYIGAGTVLTERQVEIVKEAGGKFIISPNVDEAVIKKTKELGLISMPGALTPTEIVTAVSYGADFVKLFPASNMGAGYIKAIKEPLSKVKLLVVGGINTENIKEFLKIGVCGFGIGSNIIDKKMLVEDDYAGITVLAKKYVECVKK